MINIEPYQATRTICTGVNDGAIQYEAQRCTVLGVTMKDGSPVYVVEIVTDGTTTLDVAETVRRVN